jgi:hypothetical protein
MKKIAAVAGNFFFPGLGYLILGIKPVLAVAWLAGVIGLTYVELSIKDVVPNLYWIMFGSVFVMNTAFAVDALKEANARKT